ncbi:CBN-AAT-3 protein [Aphelenchoides avenae]|nr:CBN-AAT-3 protein [Aphelenchus avenae]
MEKEPLRSATDDSIAANGKPGENEDRGLAKSLTLFNGISIIVGCIIGSGIFLSPTGVQKEAGSVGLSLLVWILCGVFVGIGSYCYAELGTLIKKSGGDYAYIMEAFGPFLAFIRLWVEAIVVRPCTCTIVALTFAIYMLRPFFPHCDPPPGSTQIIAAALIILLTAINCISVRLATFVQDTFTIAKVFALLLIIGTGAYLLLTGEPQYRTSFENIFDGTTQDVGKASLAFYSGLFAYQGWNYLNFIVEELQNPKRNLPLAILISCVSVTVIYVLTNVALYTVIGPDEMLETPAVAVEFANRIYGPLAFTMPLFVACSTLGSANGVIFTSSRLFYVGAREGHMPLVLTMINKSTRTPIPAVIFTGLLALGYLALSSNALVLINYIQISYWLAIAAAIAALFYLRKTMPDEPRPIKVNLIWPALFFIGCMALVIIPVIGNPRDTAIGILIMLTAVPVYLVFIAWKNRPKFFQQISDSVTGLAQKLFLVVDDESKQD